MMKKITPLMLIALVLTFLLPGPKVQATVGGETLIYDFRYNSADESVYYIEQDNSGRGCPPELFRLSLNTGKTSVVYSCDQGENEPNKVNDKINAIVKNFKPLSSLSLKDNQISIDVTYVRSENVSQEINEIIRRHFTVTIYQNAQKVSEFSVTGCNLNQPFTFQGYAIPGFDKKIVLLLSTKGDCFEGGYTKETLHMIGGLNNLDKSANSFSKEPSALTPNSETLVVYEAEKVSLAKPQNATTTPSEPTNTDPKNEPTNRNLFIISGIILAAVLGFGLSRMIGRRG